MLLITPHAAPNDMAVEGDIPQVLLCNASSGDKSQTMS